MLGPIIRAAYFSYLGTVRGTINTDTDYKREVLSVPYIPPKPYILISQLPI